jgi:hypothetical protein
MTSFGSTSVGQTKGFGPASFSPAKGFGPEHPASERLRSRALGTARVSARASCDATGFGPERLHQARGFGSWLEGGPEELRLHGDHNAEEQTQAQIAEAVPVPNQQFI